MSTAFKDTRSAALALLGSAAFLAISERRFLGEIAGEWGALESWQYTMLSAILDREGFQCLDLKLSKIDQLKSLAGAISRRRDLTENDRALAIACGSSAKFAIENLDWLQSFQMPVRAGLEAAV